jgi:hypothetical protein
MIGVQETHIRAIQEYNPHGDSENNGLLKQQK